MATALEIRGKSGYLRKKEEREKSGNLKGSPNIKVLLVLRFNLMISVSIKMPHQEVREISLRSVKVREDESQKSDHPV